MAGFNVITEVYPGLHTPQQFPLQVRGGAQTWLDQARDRGEWIKGDAVDRASIIETGQAADIIVRAVKRADGTMFARYG